MWLFGRRDRETCPQQSPVCLQGPGGRLKFQQKVRDVHIRVVRSRCLPFPLTLPDKLLELCESFLGDKSFLFLAPFLLTARDSWRKPQIFGVHCFNRDSDWEMPVSLQNIFISASSVQLPVQLKMACLSLSSCLCLSSLGLQVRVVMPACSYPFQKVVAVARRGGIHL